MYKRSWGELSIPASRHAWAGSKHWVESCVPAGAEGWSRAQRRMQRHCHRACSYWRGAALTPAYGRRRTPWSLWPWKSVAAAGASLCWSKPPPGGSSSRVWAPQADHKLQNRSQTQRVSAQRTCGKAVAPAGAAQLWPRAGHRPCGCRLQARSFPAIQAIGHPLRTDRTAGWYRRIRPQMQSRHRLPTTCTNSELLPLCCVAPVFKRWYTGSTQARKIHCCRKTR